MYRFLKIIIIGAVIGTGASYGQVPSRELSRNTAGPIQQPGQIPAATQSLNKFRVVRDTWDPALKSRILFLRCDPPNQCLPFVVRAPAFRPPQEIPKQIKAGRASRPRAGFASRKPVLRAGQKTSLIWEEGGIRITVPVICLDAGGVGEQIRVRAARQGGTVIRALVINASLLRGPV